MGELKFLRVLKLGDVFCRLKQVTSLSSPLPVFKALMEVVRTTSIGKTGAVSLLPRF